MLPIHAHHYIHSRLHCTQRTCHDTSQSSIHTPIKSHGGVLEYIRTVPQRTKTALRTELQRTSQREIEPVSHLIAHHAIGPVPSLHRAVHRVIEPTRSRKSTELQSKTSPPSSPPPRQTPHRQRHCQCQEDTAAARMPQ